MAFENIMGEKEIAGTEFTVYQTFPTIINKGGVTLYQTAKFQNGKELSGKRSFYSMFSSFVWSVSVPTEGFSN